MSTMLVKKERAMQIRNIVVIFPVLLMGHFGKAEAKSPPPQAQTCIGCHGSNGISNNPMWPNLAGQKKQYLIKQIKDFKGKHRKDQLMTPMANTLSEDDIEAIADYFSKLKN